MTDLTVPTGPVVLHAGTSLHAVFDADTVFAHLREDLDAELGVGWYAAVTLSDGRVIHRGQKEWGRLPRQDQLDRLVHLAVRLNKDLHHDGHWAVGMTAETRIVALWRDGDGDMHLTVEAENLWAREKRRDPDEFAAACERAWQAWHEIIDKELDFRGKDARLIKFAQGER